MSGLQTVRWARWPGDGLSKYRFAIAGSVVILATAFLAIVGPLVVQDGTPNANRQSIELAGSSLGSSFTFLKRCTEKVEVGFLEKLINGEPDNALTR